MPSPSAISLSAPSFEGQPFQNPAPIPAVSGQLQGRPVNHLNDPKIGLPSDVLFTACSDVITSALNMYARTRETVEVAFKDLEDIILERDLSKLFKRVNEIASDIEQIFNFLEGIPFIGVTSSKLRIVGGLVQLSSALLIATTAHVGLILHSQKDKREILDKWEHVEKFSREHIIHGCLNILRGLLIREIAAYTMNVGNAIMFIPNKANERNFKPFEKYTNLEEGPVV